MSRLIVMRHGNTFAAGETPRRIGSASDLDLTEEGVAQAQALGRWFAGHGVVPAKMFVGPLRRARQTAAHALAEIVDPPRPQVAAWLDEIDHGPDEGSTEAEVVRRIGAHALRRWETEGVAPPLWKTAAADRLAAWRALMARPPAGDTLLVTSNGAARFALLTLPPPRRPTSLRLRTGAYGILIDDDGWQVDAWDVRP